MLTASSDYRHTEGLFELSRKIHFDFCHRTAKEQPYHVYYHATYTVQLDDKPSYSQPGLI